MLTKVHLSWHCWSHHVVILEIIGSCVFLIVCSTLIITLMLLIDWAFALIVWSKTDLWWLLWQMLSGWLGYWVVCCSLVTVWKASEEILKCRLKPKHIQQRWVAVVVWVLRRRVYSVVWVTEIRVVVSWHLLRSSLRCIPSIVVRWLRHGWWIINLLLNLLRDP